MEESKLMVSTCVLCNEQFTKESIEEPHKDCKGDLAAVFADTGHSDQVSSPVAFVT